MSVRFMTELDFVDIESAKDYPDLRVVAMRVLGRMKERPVVQVCGPISTGGLGSPHKNAERLHRVIGDYETRGINVFNQIVFEPRIKSFFLPGEDGYDWNILHQFYQPLFELRYISELHFLPDWSSSIGASWEHEVALRLHLKIVYIEMSVDEYPLRHAS